MPLRSAPRAGASTRARIAIASTALATIGITLAAAAPASAAPAEWPDPVLLLPVTNAATAPVLTSALGALGANEPVRGQTVVVDYALQSSDLLAGTAAFDLALPPGVSVDPHLTAVTADGGIQVSSDCEVGAPVQSIVAPPAGTTEIAVGCIIPFAQPTGGTEMGFRLGLAFDESAPTLVTVSLFGADSGTPHFEGLDILLHTPSIGQEPTDAATPPALVDSGSASEGTASPAPTLAATGSTGGDATVPIAVAALCIGAALVIAGSARRRLGRPEGR
ncbi:MAG: hypothetical protein J0I43_01440 [Microbacterium sp.]|uniref:hypothetical protein n=1 Tax=Microbacterium sp. TaxID=51671 RepID=UPI001ACAE38D|nr:hypothetical protein [Microbacterium sp.]MBN9176024.1 hypothetical protein [Microbacterium sp.]